MDLIERIYKAFSSDLGFFIVDEAIDDPRDVIMVLRKAGVAQLTEFRQVSHSPKIHIVEISSKPCYHECIYRVCSGKDDDCIDTCVAECVSTRRKRIVKALSNLLRREMSSVRGSP